MVFVEWLVSLIEGKFLSYVFSKESLDVVNGIFMGFVKIFVEVIEVVFIRN